MDICFIIPSCVLVLTLAYYKSHGSMLFIMFFLLTYVVSVTFQNVVTYAVRVDAGLIKYKMIAKLHFDVHDKVSM